MPPPPQREPATVGETSGDRARRYSRYRVARAAWDRLAFAKCSRCGLARINVVHETDPATAPEEPDYYVGMSLHEFVPAPPTDTLTQADPSRR